MLYLPSCEAVLPRLSLSAAAMLLGMSSVMSRCLTRSPLKALPPVSEINCFVLPLPAAGIRTSSEKLITRSSSGEDGAAGISSAP